MIPEKRVVRRIQSGGCAIHCQDCSISQLCIPFTLNEHELDQLDINTEHPSFAQALETSMVCEIPFETLDDLSGKMPNLRQQMMRLMSGEIKGDQEMILLLSKKNAEERLAAFIYNLSRRFAQRGFSPREFRLTMTRGDIGNYLGLTVETISRLLGRFQKSGMLSVKGKYITIEDSEMLSELAGKLPSSTEA